MVMIKRSIRQGLVRTQSANPNSLGNNGVNNHHKEHNEHDVDQEKQIQNGDGPQAGLLHITFGGALNPIDDVEQPMASFRNKGVDVEGKPRLQRPETLQAESGSERGIGDEKPGLAGEEEREQGAEEGDPGGDGVAFGLQLGGLDGSRGGGDGGLEVEESAGDGEE